MIVLHKIFKWILNCVVFEIFRDFLPLLALLVPFIFFIETDYINLNKKLLFFLVCPIASVLLFILSIFLIIKIDEIENNLCEKIESFELKKKQYQKLNSYEKILADYKYIPSNKENFLKNFELDYTSDKEVETENFHKTNDTKELFDENLKEENTNSEINIETNSTETTNYLPNKKEIITDNFKSKNDIKKSLDENLKEENNNSESEIKTINTETINQLPNRKDINNDNFQNESDDENLTDIKITKNIEIIESNSEVIKELNEIFISNDYLEDLVSTNSNEYNKIFPKKNSNDLFDDYLKKQETGLDGELFVLDFERNELIKNKRPDLAIKVEHLSLINDSLGYDILSFDEKGNKKFIEVKSTVGNYKADFFLTENEMNTIQRLENYFIYRVFNVNNDLTNKNLYIINCNVELDKFFIVKPSQYKVTPRKK